MGLLADAAGFPLMVSAFKGNETQIRTMLPVVKAFMALHRLVEVVVVAGPAMVSVDPRPPDDRLRRSGSQPADRRHHHLVRQGARQDPGRYRPPTSLSASTITTGGLLPADVNAALQTIKDRAAAP